MAFVNGVTAIIFALSIATSAGLTLRSEGKSSEADPYHIVDLKSHDSRPGSPQLPGLTGKASTWQEKLGERLVKAAEAKDAMKACGSFFSFGDYTWCEKAMPAKTEWAKNNFKVWTGHSYKGLSKSAERNQESNGQFLGLSYGVFTSDPWSEIVSNRYHVATRLHDCFYEGDQGPLASDLHIGDSNYHECEGRGCYNVKYEAKRVCLGAAPQMKDGRMYEPLSVGLKGRKPLSTFVKIDAEGAEWDALEQLLASPKDLEKIRTLDLELHFNLPGGTMTEKEIERKVKIIEQLATVYAVTGTTMDPLHNVLDSQRKKDLSKGIKKSENGWAGSKTPPNVYPSNGLSLDQWCISFVNRKLL